MNVWTSQWKTQGEESVTAKHPAYPGQEHRLTRYFIEASGRAHEFAAGEVSPGVWLFLVPAGHAQDSVFIQVATYAIGTAGCFILIRGFEHSAIHVALGAALLALAAVGEWYARSKRDKSEA